MAFTVLVNSTTADPNDANNNFYHVAQGSIYPMTGTMLEYDAGTVNLGSGAAKWAALYANNIHGTVTVDGTTASYMWQSVYNTTLVASTTRIEITGINGDASIEYYIIIKLLTGKTNTTVYLFPNSDSASANYISRYSYYTATTAQTNGSLLIELISKCGGVSSAADEVGFCYSCIKSKTGSYRYGYVNSFSGCNANITIRTTGGFMWENSASTITSLVIESIEMAPGTFIGIWRRG